MVFRSEIASTLTRSSNISSRWTNCLWRYCGGTDGRDASVARRTSGVQVTVNLCRQQTRKRSLGTRGAHWDGTCRSCAAVSRTVMAWNARGADQVREFDSSGSEPCGGTMRCKTSWNVLTFRVKLRLQRWHATIIFNLEFESLKLQYPHSEIKTKSFSNNYTKFDKRFHNSRIVLASLKYWWRFWN